MGLRDLPTNEIGKQTQMGMSMSGDSIMHQLATVRSMLDISRLQLDRVASMVIVMRQP